MRADAAALKFRNNILSLGDDHLAKRVYVGLRDERGRLGTSHIKNGVRGYLEKLAEDANWGTAGLGKHAAKTKAIKYVAAEQRRIFEAELEDKSTLAGYAKVTRRDRRGLPEYLVRACPYGLRHGRRLKTKFRLGVHQLQECLARMVPRSARTAAHSRCGCCSAGVDESIEHALFECKTHDEIRAEFLGRVEKVYPPFGGMSTDARIRLLLADDTPKEIDSIFYRFLIQLFASRERGLASGPAGGRP